MCYILMAWHYRDYDDYMCYIAYPFCYGELCLATYLTKELIPRQFFLMSNLVAYSENVESVGINSLERLSRDFIPKMMPKSANSVWPCSGNHDPDSGNNLWILQELRKTYSASGCSGILWRQLWFEQTCSCLGTTQQCPC
jgi:hypothetical protein